MIAQGTMKALPCFLVKQESLSISAHLVLLDQSQKNRENLVSNGRCIRLALFRLNGLFLGHENEASGMGG